MKDENGCLKCKECGEFPSLLGEGNFIRKYTGEENIMIYTRENGYYVCCERCNFFTPHFSDKNMATESWNQRYGE